MTNENLTTRRDTRIDWLVAVGAAFLAITLCSTCSFLYSFNYWCDPNIMFTAGKSMFNGMVLYRDVFDHKGPLLYVLYGLASLVSRTSFFGVYLLEWAAASCFGFLTLKTLRLYTGPRAARLLTPLCLAVVYASAAFAMGDSAEELCLPLLMYPCYAALRAIRRRRWFSPWELFAVGVMGACVLWIKLNMLAFFVAWALLPMGHLLRRGRWRELLKSAGLILGGVAAVTLPFFLYFAANRALGDWWTVYFYDNLFLYSDAGLLPQADLWQSLWYDLKNSPLLMGFGLLGLLGLAVRRRWAELAQTGLCFAVLAVTLHITGFYLVYYGLILGVFVPLGGLVLAEGLEALLQKKPGRARRAVAGAVCALLFFGVLASSSNLPQLRQNPDATAQFRFRDRILSSGVEDPTLLSYGYFDMGFYTLCDILPTCKYYCVNNLPIREMWAEQIRCVMAGEVDFVVVFNMEFTYDNYRLLDECGGYYLYARSDLPV